MANEKIKCSPQNSAHFEANCKSCDCKIESKVTNRFGVITYEVSHKTVKGLKEFKAKLKS